MDIFNIYETTEKIDISKALDVFIHEFEVLITALRTKKEEIKNSDEDIANFMFCEILENLRAVHEANTEIINCIMDCPKLTQYLERILF